MSFNNSNPISKVPGVNTATKYSRLYNNQFFDYLSEQLPTNHQDMFRWCEVVYGNTPVVVNAVRMLINYPITSLIYKSDSEKVRTATKQLLEDDLDIYGHLLNLGLDYYIYGNAFRNIYFPFTRFLKCSVCDEEVNIAHATYEVKRGEFILECSKCQQKRKASIEDKQNDNLSDIKLVSWNPKNIELNSNPITGDTTYYYSIPGELKLSIHRGDLNAVRSIPEVFIRATKASRQIKMSDNFFHFKTSTISGFSTGWGLSPLVPVLKLYLYISILRKSVEAIGLEHITPQRILFPQSTTSDPSIMSNMTTWKEQVQKALQAWRKDPNYVMLAPYPTGVANIGSQGRALMPTAEIKAAEEDMLRALDVPIEFVFGSNNLQNSPVSLRILENRLRPYVAQVTRYVNWVINTINAQYGKNFCPVEFTPFTLADDMMKKQLLISMQGNGVSRTTIQESLDLNPDEEREKIKNETLDDLKQQKELEREQHALENDIANQAVDEQEAEQQGTIPKYNQQKLIANAQLQAQGLLQIPYEERRSALAQLQNEDYVMWALVTKQMESLRDAAKATTSTTDSAQQ